jgi:hypothetical protein
MKLIELIREKLEDRLTAIENDSFIIVDGIDIQNSVGNLNTQKWYVLDANTCEILYDMSVDYTPNNASLTVDCKYDPDLSIVSVSFDINTIPNMILFYTNVFKKIDVGS